MKSQLRLLQRPTRVLMSAAASSLLILSAGPTLAADTPARPMAPSKEMRAKMAAMHEQMAACLRSDKPLSECRAEMMKHCETTMGNQGCSMMMGAGGGMMGKGQGMHGHMMSSPPSNSGTPK